MIENLYFILDSFWSISLRKDVRHGYHGYANYLHMIGFQLDPFSASAAVSAEMLCFYKSPQYSGRDLTGFWAIQVLLSSLL